MKLLDRYLHAVGQYLPAETKEDTLAELRANLLAQMEGREEELGRSLTDAEIAGILKAHGKPEVVAVRYLPQRSLIGPTVFPFYLFTLKRALPFMAAIYAVARTAEIAFGHATGLLSNQIVGAVLQFIPTLLTYWAIMTAVFAGIEVEAHRRSKDHWNDWDPAKLPEPSADKSRSLAWRVTDLVVQALLVLYVAAVPYHPYLILGPGEGYLDRVPAGLSPEWHVFYLGVLILATGQLAIKAFELFWFTRRSVAGMDLVVKAMGVGILSLMVAARVYFIPKGAEDLPRILSMNAWVGAGFKIALILVAADFLWNLWKFVRTGSGKAHLVLS